MNPSSHAKPVMDVAASKKTALTPARRAVSELIARRSQLPARSVPALPTAPSQEASLPAAPVRVASQRRAAAPALAQHHAPVGLITVAVFIMLVLSALAVTLYVTLRTA
jgi:hypothetical protein